jgi:lipoprotein-anchoring transpeptidase ErfK/SrfK
MNEDAIAAWVAAQNSNFGDERFVEPSAAIPALTDAFKNSQRETKLQISHGEREHVVKAGETLSSIAFDYGMPYPWIQAANPGLGDALFVGNRIKIPSQDRLLPLPVVENKRIIINMTKQKMQAYENGKLKWDWAASTGIPSSPTSPGVFQIQTHEEMAYAGQWNLYMPWFMGIYRPVPNQDFMNGFHGFPSRDRRQLLWTKDLGHRVTYGCILLSTDNAKTLYDWAEKGVVVEIVP